MHSQSVENLTCDKKYFDNVNKKSVFNNYSSLKCSFINVHKKNSNFCSSTVFNIPIYLFVFIYLPLSCEGFCPLQCVCEYEYLRVQCTNASLEHIPFLLSPQIESLGLPCNKIESVGQSLAFYPDLKKVDLSYNRISSIEQKDFEAQQNLAVLNLSKNKLKSIHNKSLEPLLSLQEIYLSNNAIALIEPNSFDNSNELKLVDLSHNKLHSLNTNTFGDKSEIQVIKLGFNYFYEVPSNALSKIQSLRELDLTGNLIYEVAKDAFHSLKNLSFISLDKNNISLLHPQSFSGLYELKSLSIKDNRLSAISGEYFRSLNSLQSLDLSGNLFQELEKTAFAHLPSLLHLRMTRCPRLSRIHSDTFISLRSLKTLQLSHNARLVYLGSSIFSSLEELTDLDLTACGLIYVHPGQMPRNTATKLHLAGNPLHCNCSLMWLASLPFNDSIYLDTPTCATPPKLYGIPVNKVDLSAAGCDHQLGLTAIGTCVGVVLLGLLVIAAFLAWRWSKRTLVSAKTLPGASDRGVRDPWGGAPPPPPDPLTFQGAPIYAQKYCLPTQVSTSSCNQTQCQGGGHSVVHPPYALHPVTRPLLTPPSPSINSHSHLPVDWLYPSPYDEDTHWYTTIGRDGREYLTGEIKRDHPTPPPLSPDSPPPHPSLPPSAPVSPRLKKQNLSVGQRTPVVPSRTPPKVGLESSDGQHIPVTYI